MAGRDYYYYRKEVWIAFSWLSRFSGCLSVIGSSLIIFIIVRGGKEKLSRIHNRLLVCMCSVDIINSINLALTVTMNPSRLHPHMYGASGNNTTCRIQGFLLTVGFAVPMYLSVLCLYFMAIIRYDTKEEVLQKIEPYAHGIAVLIPLATAIYGVSFDLFHPTFAGYCFGGDGCYTTADLNNAECEPRPLILINILDWMFYFLASLVFIVIACSMTLTWLAVRNQTSQMRRYDFRRGSMMPQSPQSHQRLSIYALRRSVTSLRQSFTLDNTTHNTTPDGGADVRRGQQKDDETFSQAILYVLAYVFSYGFPIAYNIHYATESLPSPVLCLLTAFFYPLQGFWNFCIYVRPKYFLVKKTMRDTSFWSKLIIVLKTKDLDRFLLQERIRNRGDITRVNPSRLRVLQLARITSRGEEEEEHEEGEEEEEDEEKKSRSIEATPSHEVEEDEINPVAISMDRFSTPKKEKEKPVIK